MASGFITSRSRGPQLDVRNKCSVNDFLFGPEPVRRLTLNRVSSMFFITPPEAVTGAGSTSCARFAGHLLLRASITTSYAALYPVHHLLRQNRRRSPEALLFEKAWIRSHKLMESARNSASFTCCGCFPFPSWSICISSS